MCPLHRRLGVCLHGLAGATRRMAPGAISFPLVDVLRFLMAEAGRRWLAAALGD
jgi:hypothetical protein